MGVCTYLCVCGLLELSDGDVGQWRCVNMLRVCVFICVYLRVCLRVGDLFEVSDGDVGQ
jgi:hypothetical protein